MDLAWQNYLDTKPARSSQNPDVFPGNPADSEAAARAATDTMKISAATASALGGFWPVPLVTIAAKDSMASRQKPARPQRRTIIREAVHGASQGSRAATAEAGLDRAVGQRQARQRPGRQVGSHNGRGGSASTCASRVAWRSAKL